MAELNDAVAAAAFNRLLRHLRMRSDVQNVDLMGLAGFCRNCLADWIIEAAPGTLTRDEAREQVYGMAPSEVEGAPPDRSDGRADQPHERQCRGERTSAERSG